MMNFLINFIVITACVYGVFRLACAAAKAIGESMAEAYESGMEDALNAVEQTLESQSLNIDIMINRNDTLQEIRYVSKDNICVVGGNIGGEKVE